MTDPENHTIRLLREIRSAIEALDDKVDRLNDKVDRNGVEITDRIEKLRKLAFGESVLGRYAAGEVEERLEAVEQRLSDLESRG
ncbi:hypothetical protein PQJ75_12090 [Rhodoplanes sp. TEM]|uniref:Uncharacterized protein n=1 Tax=Rhodoplanes tepidamans TaxID=200616 RepID=A0ABT5J538_RHOTP|nr:MULTISPECIES: hypothetical protein [Rhodoplanes]MDC7784567.1 hypothetical protein [Rhodoplanes tepidamans]MDC7984474.1 hypothetical protein [Rhodoplanes sp. TEM]MDQ0355795.1 polyhydroxyalkanoate synthesis regulator phasin [Rhodoplanes tepidamans]